MLNQIRKQRKPSTPIEAFPENLVGAVSAETAKRIAGREEILIRFRQMAESAAMQHGTRVVRVNIRPTWSHEYEERSGVAVDLDVVASDEARFAYWEALDECIDKLAQSLPLADRNWLENEVSLTVIRS
jgi:hypothetical protein